MNLLSFKQTTLFCGAVALLFVCGAGLVASAQKSARPSFSGTWLMETAGRSLDLSEKDVIIERTAPTPSQMTLKISDDGNDIKVFRTFVMADETQEQTLVYHVDGRGETNPTVGSLKRIFPTHTRWTRDRLVIRFDPFNASVSGRPLTGRREIEWRLTDGGTKLVETDTIRYQENTMIDSTVSASDMRQPSFLPPSITVRRVYKKQS